MNNTQSLTPPTLPKAKDNFFAPIRDEQMRIGLEQTAEAERTKEKSPTGTTIFI